MKDALPVLVTLAVALASDSSLAADLEYLSAPWPSAGTVLHPDGSGEWSVALDRASLSADQFAEASILVVQTGTSAGETWEDRTSAFGTVSRGNGLGISRDYHATYGPDRSGENDMTGDAALYLRYTTTGKLPAFYRVQIMARGSDCGEASIYSPAGGIVAVTPYAFNQGTAYSLRAEVQGNTVTVKVNGATVLTWTDGNAGRPTEGRAGVGALRAKVEIRDVLTGELAAGSVVAPSATRDFKLRVWNAAHPHLWLFDGNEPVFQLFESGQSAELRCVKIRPCYLPALETMPLQVTQWVGDTAHLSVYNGMTETKTGNAWEGKFDVKAKSGDATAVIRVAVSYDATRNAYVYEYEPTVTFPSWLPVSADIEWLDLYPAAIMGSRIDSIPPLRQRDTQWFAWEQPDGKQARKMNMTHHWRTLGVPEGMTSPLFTDHPENQDVLTGGLAAWGVDDDQNIAVRVVDDSGFTQFVELCEWAFDIHWRMRTPNWRLDGIPAGTSFTTLATITSEPKETVSALVDSARHQLDGLVDNEIRPLLTWPTTTFDQARPGFDPANNAAFFTGGVYDTAGGIGGSAAVRVDSSHRNLSIDSGVEMGTAGYFPERCTRFGDRTVSFKARTQSGTGTLNLKLVQSTFRSQIQEQAFAIGDAWTTYSMDAEALNAMHQGGIYFRHDGGNPVWIDDLTFSEVPVDTSFTAVFEPEAYVTDHNSDYLIADAAAGNGYAVVFLNGNNAGGIFCNSYNTSAPAGDYEAVVRCKVSSISISDIMAEVWIGQRNTRGAGAGQPLTGANGSLKGNMFGQANVYQDMVFPFHRDGAGGLDVHLEYSSGASQGSITIDRVAIRRIRDAWGNLITTPDSPTVSITSPADGATYVEPASITIDASVTDFDGTVSKVEFLQGGVMLGEDTVSPYSLTWNNVPAGSYSLTVRATHSSGPAITSAAIAVTVTADDDTSSDATPPTVVSTTPVAGDTDVDVRTTITANFSGQMLATATEAAFTLKDEAGTVVAGVTVWSADGISLTFIPDAGLDYDLTYTVSVTDAASDLDGVSLDGDGNTVPGGDYVWTFGTLTELGTFDTGFGCAAFGGGAPSIFAALALAVVAFGIIRSHQIAELRWA